MNKIHSLIIALPLLLLTACSSDNFGDDIEPQVGAIVPDKLLDTDDVNPMLGSKASLAFILSKSKMEYNWDNGDIIGVFNISYPHESSYNTGFWYKPNTSVRDENKTTGRFANNNYSFDQEHYWVSYSPRMCVEGTNGRKIVEDYNNIELTYSGQRQTVNATPAGKAPTAANGYGDASEKAATAHLGAYDFLISDPAQPDETGFTTFKFKHVGSTVRFYMLFPEGGFGGKGCTAKIKTMELISNSNILVDKATLCINPAGGTPSYTQKSTTTTKSLLLNLGTDANGLIIPDNGYLIAYMEMHPVNVPNKDCFLFVTAEVSGKEKYFKSLPLPALNIGAGSLYQWSTRDFLEPIELTATLLPWQDIVAGNISTGE